MTSRTMSVARLAAMLNEQIAALATALLGDPNRRHSTTHQLRFGTKGSIAVELAGEHAGRWYDFEAGTGGAGLELVEHQLKLDKKAARDWARKWLGQSSEGYGRAAGLAAPALPPLKSSKPKVTADAGRAAKVTSIVAQAEDPALSPVVTYLRSRGITTPLPDCIRYRPAAQGKYGAMVALATDADGAVLAVQQVYLTSEGRKAPVKVVKRINKAVDGWASRAAVRLPGKTPLILCEGVETALSIWQATGQEVWACLSVANIGQAPVPDKTTVTIARDGDPSGSEANRQVSLAAKSLARGRTVQVAAPPENQDFNDVLLRERAEGIRKRIACAERVSPTLTDPVRGALKIGSDVEIANRVREDLNDAHGLIIHDEGEFWRYGGTHWEPIPAHEIRLRVHAYDGARFETPADKTSVVKLGKARLDSILNECAVLCAEVGFFADPAVGINCSSGFIRFDETGTPHHEPHHPAHRCRHTLPGRLQSGKGGALPEDSLLERLLTGIFKGEPDAEAKRALLAEICGAAALGYATRLIQPRAVILHGKSAENGKSQVLELARGLLPPSAICSVPAAKMNDEHHVVALAGKLLNASDELSPAAIVSDTFKSVVTGEPIQGRDVYKSRIEFRSMAQNLFATNELPSFKGGVDRGVQRRLLLIPFLRTIPAEERIEGIGKRIATEEPDLLLAWAVEGASRLIRQRQFSVPASCQEALSEWLLSEDPVLAWIEACVDVQPIRNGAPSITTRDAYNRFMKWASAEGFRPDTLPEIRGFVQRVQARAQGVQYRRTNKGRFFMGLAVTHR